MKLKIRSHLTGSLLLAGALAVTAGCGYKTSPVPPQTVVPKAIEDLTYSLDKKGANLTWSYPTEAINGKDLEEIASFDLYRAEIPLKDFCSSCPIPFGAPMELPGGAVGEEKRNRGEHVSGMLRTGHKYFFKITSRTSWLASSADSNIISFVYHTPAAAPKGVAAVSGDKNVQITWEPVTVLVDGSPSDLPLSYQVLKSSNGRDFSAASPVLEKTSYVDKNVKSGASYYYKVLSSMISEAEVIDGTASEAVMVKVIDAVPPSRVTGVTVVASSSNVRIFWDASDAKDLAGYRIYRRAGSEAEPEMIGEAGRNQTIFVDNELKEGAEVYYSVAAFDTDGNEGEKIRRDHNQALTDGMDHIFPLPFKKMSGTGNDFIVIDHRSLRIPKEKQAELSRLVCRRMFSAGADGVILIENSETADFRWQFYNSDGSVAEMCGNGARCAARFAFEEGIAGSTMRFETIAGVIEAEICEKKDVRVKMTDPFDYRDGLKISLAGVERDLSYINTGVPHAVLFVDEDCPEVTKWGKLIRFHSLFAPAGTNVNFVSRLGENRLKVRTYERGVEDETRACGTGTVASAIIASIKNEVSPPVEVITSGGDRLMVEFEVKEKGRVDTIYLKGPARIIYQGELTAESLL